MSIDMVAEDMVTRYHAHKVAVRDIRKTSGDPHRFLASCSCTWTSGADSKDWRAQRTAADGHLLDVLPDWPRGECRVCGRAILCSPLGNWFHVEWIMHGHDANPEDGWQGGR